MSRYDDERIVALLHEAVPSIPDPPDRVAAIRHRAGRQRAAVWSQTLGAVASVVLVVGVAAAVANTGASDLRPTSDPLTALAGAFEREESFRFELATGLVGPITKPVESLSFRSAEEAEQRLTSHVVGGADRDGNAFVDGDFSIFQRSDEFALRVVDGDMYMTMPAELAGRMGGKTWLKSSASEDQPAPQESVPSFLKLVSGIATDVHYVRRATVRGTPVTEYALTLPEKWTKTDDITVTFALDAENRLRRVNGEFSYMAFETALGFGFGSRGPLDPPQTPSADSDPLMVRVELLVFGYGDRIDVTAPPESEVFDPEKDGVITDSEFSESSHAVSAELVRCLTEAENDDAARKACVRKNGPANGNLMILTPTPSP